MDLWSRLAELLLRLIDRSDAPALALLLLVDDAGVALPVPGDLLMTLAGYRVGQGQMSLFWALPLLELGGVLGASIQYWFGARGGRPLLDRYGRALRLAPARRARVEGWVLRHAPLAVVLGRLVP